MSARTKRPFTETMDEPSRPPRFSLFSSLDSFKRRKPSEFRSDTASFLPHASMARPLPLASRVLNAMQGKLQSGDLLNPPKPSESFRPSSSRASLASTTGNQSSVSDSLRNSLGNQSSLLQKQGFAIVGTTSLGIRPQNPSPDVLRLKLALLQDYRARLAAKEKLLADEFDAESERVVAERRKQHAKLEEQRSVRIGAKHGEYVLSADQQQLVDRFFRTAASRPRDVAVDAYRIELTYSDLATLQPKRWLNDNVIDMFLQTVVAKNPRNFVFTTHFFTRLEEDGYPAVRRWAMRKKINVFEQDRVFVPVNCGNSHWTLAVVNNVDKQLEYYDSLPGRVSNKFKLELLLDYLRKEADRLGRECPEYTLVERAEAPAQENGFDCGVFVCEAVSKLAENRDLSHSQSDMPGIRNRMAYTLIELRDKSKL